MIFRPQLGSRLIGRADSSVLPILGTFFVVVSVATAAVIIVSRGAPVSSAGLGAGILRRPRAVHVVLPHRPMSYLGVYESDAPGSYAGVDRFAQVTGRQPNVVLFYSGWWVPFQTAFAEAARAHGALPFVQLDPDHISLSAIAHGKYDGYLTGYADAVTAYGHGVIIGFGHEMNGDWYTWGYKRTPATAFVAAWRHIVTIFRKQGADNVTWLWTVNIINRRRSAIPNPAPWWPGRSYVTWIGIDGYYLKPSWMFRPLFGPTIKEVRALTRSPIPILIAETGAAPIAGKPTKITNLFAGIRSYGLLGLVWFDANQNGDWRINSPAALAAFRRGAKAYLRRTS